MSFEFTPSEILNKDEFEELFYEHMKKYNLEYLDYNSSSVKGKPTFQHVYSKDGRDLTDEQEFSVIVDLLN